MAITKIRTVFNPANQKITVVDVQGRKYESMSIKNPETIRSILNLAHTLTRHERDILGDILNLID
jgi:hypothetical protein